MLLAEVSFGGQCVVGFAAKAEVFWRGWAAAAEGDFMVELEAAGFAAALAAGVDVGAATGVAVPDLRTHTRRDVAGGIARRSTRGGDAPVQIILVRARTAPARIIFVRARTALARIFAFVRGLRSAPARRLGLRRSLLRAAFALRQIIDQETPPPAIPITHPQLLRSSAASGALVAYAALQQRENSSTARILLRVAGMSVYAKAVCVAALTLVSCGPPVMPPTSAHAPPEAAQAPATLDGEILGIDKQSPETHLAQNVVLRVQTESGQVDMLLAPSWVLDEKGLSFAPKERVQVKGTQRFEAGHSVFEVQTLKRGEDVIELRDDAGKPLWPTR